MTDKELKPCPCCNGTAYWEHSSDKEWWWVECEECEMRTVDHVEPHKELAIEAWNTRKAPYIPEVIDDIEANSFYESFNMSMHNGEPLKIAIPKALKVMIKPVQNNLSKP